MADPKDQPVDFDDLLSLAEDEEQAESTTESTPEPETEAAPEAAPVEDTAVPVETPEQKRIRELEAALAAPLPTASSDSPEEETPEQKRIKELEDKLAQRNALIIDRAPETYVEDAGPGEKILIHFLEDGFSAFGQIWSKGQEVEIVVGSEAWKRTLNREGKSWLELRSNPTAQRLKYGKTIFGEGPYIWREGEEFDLSVAQADVRRGRRVPVTAAV